MSSTIQANASQSSVLSGPLSRIPSATRQASYLATGCLAGATTPLVELAWSSIVLKHPQSTLSFLRSHAPAPVFRAGVRFWTFDIVRKQLSQTPLPVWVAGGLGGAAGGFNEVLFHSLFLRQRPALTALASQSLKLFFCFGTYTFLSTHLSEALPPKPFPWCWCMGATAGAVGSGIVARLEGVRGRELWLRAVPKGALTIGTVIAVQVTSCAALLQRVEP